MQVDAEQRLGETLRLQLLLVLRLATAEVLRLDLLDARVDVLVADDDPEALRPLLELVLLDEVLHRLILERLVLRRARLRERCFPRGVRALGAVHQRVEQHLRDRVAADDGNRVRRDAPGATAAAACGDEHEGDQRGKRQKTEKSHVDPKARMALKAGYSGEVGRLTLPGGPPR